MKAIRELEVGDICNNTLVYVGTAYRKKNLFDTLYQKDIENGVNIIFVDVLHINEDWFALGTFITYDLVSHSYAEFETEENESYKKRVKENLLKIKMLHGKDLAITDDWSIYTDSVKNVIAQKEIEFR